MKLAQMPSAASRRRACQGTEQFTTALSFTVLTHLKIRFVQFASGHQELAKVHKQHLPSALSTDAEQVGLPCRLRCRLSVSKHG